MSGVVMCIISLALANFGVEWFHNDVPNYLDALAITWHQLCALLIYYFLWVREELFKHG